MTQLVVRVVKKTEDHKVNTGLVIIGRRVIMLVSVHDPAGRPSGEENRGSQGEHMSGSLWAVCYYACQCT